MMGDAAAGVNQPARAAHKVHPSKNRRFTVQIYKALNHLERRPFRCTRVVRKLR
jgi:hypothetical protein